MEHAPAAMCAALGPRTQHTRRLDRVQSQIDAYRRGQEGMRPQGRTGERTTTVILEANVPDARGLRAGRQGPAHSHRRWNGDLRRRQPLLLYLADSPGEVAPPSPCLEPRRPG
ncbi:hypothetical protein Srufu_075990 [Streptomyces libani subsp. rufus]|nr:hypothetical protein Srufu_075990 [Streptomyces libani subsp. rufus]